MSTRDLSTVEYHFFICNGGTCMRNQGEEVTRAIRNEITRHDAGDQIHTTRTRCNGRCDDACVTIVYPDGHWYRNVTPELGRELVRTYLTGNMPPSQLGHLFMLRHFVEVTTQRDEECPS
ncbi:(2Fe-2S) ferredoxin domain-containing protein [Alicyclobacillus suci]|uniref:(2Fe-2S) ferredoxin domain-containing protein n=1 Tax=Alicyclobacillus suci TaxID=2816080 RepID=UPI001A8D345F